MKVIVGLGNPGAEYEDTRHNVGRMIAAAIAKHFELEPLRDEKKYLGLFTKGKIAGEPASLLLPDTFMNKSGKAVVLLKPKAQDIIVIHDDTDMELGRFKISFAKNSAGHKGVESVMKAIKTKEFWRIRIGVQRKKRVPAEHLVLQKFKPEEKRIVKKIEKEIFEILESPLQVTTRTV